MVIVLAAGLVACSPPPETMLGPYPPSAEIVDRSCGSGLRLRQIGLCTDAPGLLAKTTDRKPPSDDCRWTITELPLADDAIIVVRHIVCKPVLYWNGERYQEDQYRSGFSPTHPSLMRKYPGSYGIDWNVPSSIVTIQYEPVRFYPLAPNQTAEQFAIDHQTTGRPRGTATPTCGTQPVTDAGFAGEAFDLHASDGSRWCGDGVWEKRQGFVLLHGVGSLNHIDKSSYALYRRDGSGGWRRAA